MLQELLDVVISGLTTGSVYAVMAAGMALVYGVSKVFNFAYGSFYTLGGYLAWLFLSQKLPYLLVLALLIPSLYISGYLTERWVIRPLRNRRDWEMLVMLVTLGLAIFMDNYYLILFGSFVKKIPPLTTGSIEIGTVVISFQDAAIFLIAIVAISLLIFFLQKTRQGKAVRAVSQDMTGAQIVGIAKDRIFSMIFAISTVLVGTSGMLLGPKYFVSPLGGWDILIKAWVITALGGMGSVMGSLFAAFLLGIIEALVAWQFGFTRILFAWFGVLIITLIIRPQGLFGVRR
ncbi:MAG: branched-chain amino acid ABC transporter permease [Marinobacter sp.]